MDNASKALRIAGAVLLGLMVTSLLLLAYNAWTKYQRTNLQSIENEQTSKFNGQFDVYNKKALRGSDLVSLANKINSTNRKMAGEPNYNIYDKTEDIRKNMNYRYPETDLMPMRAFVEFHEDKSPSYKVIEKPGNLPGQAYYGILPWYNGFGHTNNLIDLDEYVQKIYNDDDLYKRAKADGQDYRKVFKGYYFECIGVEFDNRNGRYSKFYFKQVFKIN